MTIVRYVLDPSHPPKMSEEARARLAALTDEQITAAAMSDPDNPLPTDEESERVRAIKIARAARERSGLSETQFARTFGIDEARLRALGCERGRPDVALVSLLILIADDPERAAGLLRKGPEPVLETAEAR